MENIKQMLPLLIPVAVIEISLMVAALVHIFTHKKYRVGNRALWVVVSIIFNIIGPILYFVIGRDDE